MAKKKHKAPATASPTYEHEPVDAETLVIRNKNPAPAESEATSSTAVPPEEEEFSEAVAKYLSEKVDLVDLIEREGSEDNMPVNKGEEEAHTGGNLTDQVAKESKDSSASSHEIHQKATAQDHQATPGPVISENIGQPASKEELKARAAELNK